MKTFSMPGNLNRFVSIMLILAVSIFGLIGCGKSNQTLTAAVTENVESIEHSEASIKKEPIPEQEVEVVEDAEDTKDREDDGLYDEKTEDVEEALSIEEDQSPDVVEQPVSEEVVAESSDVPNTTDSSYLDVDIDNQLVRYYVNGEVVYECSCVTGDATLGRDTPKGTFQLTSHDRGARLQGPTWDCYVSYWMRFYDGCGFHDATWRDASEFGGTTYMGNGSHGCVNLTYTDAENIFNLVNVGTTVIVH